MKRPAVLLIALLVCASAAHATVRTITAGADKISIPAALGSCVSGDTLVLSAGTYTFTAGKFIIITDSGALGLGAPFTSLTIRGVSAASVIIDCTPGAASPAIYGGDAAKVTLANMTFVGMTGGNGFIRDASNSAYQGWTFQNLKFGSGTNTPFKLGYAGWPPATGTGITFHGLTTTSAFGGLNVIDIVGARNNLDMLIDGVDARLHNGTLQRGIHMTNVWDVRIRNVRVDDPLDTGMTIEPTAADSAATKIGAVNTVRKIYISDVWVRRAANVGVHIGNTDGHDVHASWPRGMTSDVHMNNIRVEGTVTGYGIEYENLVTECSLVGFYVYNCVNYGVALAEDTERILVSGGFVDTITGVNSTGIITAAGQQNIITNNFIRNCDTAFKIQYNASFIITPARHIVRENTVANVKYLYGINSDSSMPSDVTANMLGPNTVVTPTVAFANTQDHGALTQAQFVAQYPTNIDAPDIVVGAVPVNWLPPTLSTTIVGKWFVGGGLITAWSGAN